jgi:hypothetical protein
MKMQTRKLGTYAISRDLEARR